MKGQKPLGLAVAIAMGLVSHTASAMPDATSGNPLDLLGIITPDSVGDISRDHQNPNTLYVGPARIKEIQGTYAELGDAGPMCVDFVNIQRQAYYMPATLPLKEQAFYDGDYVSNYFQMTYAIPKTNLTQLHNISLRYSELLELDDENATALKNYRTISNKWLGLERDITAVKTDIDKLKEDYQTRSLALGTEFANANTECVKETDPTKLVECITAASLEYSNKKRELDNEYLADKIELDEQLNGYRDQKDEISDEYYDLFGWYQAFEERRDILVDAVNFYSALYIAQVNIAERSWKIETDLLNEEEDKIVGRASAGYNLFGNETIDLANALAQNDQHQYEVKQLDVFNVKVNPGITSDNLTTEIDNGATLFTKNVWRYPAHTLMNSEVLEEWDMPFQTEGAAPDEYIQFDAMGRNSFASGNVDFYVTKGARCGGYKQQITENYTSDTIDGDSVSWSVTNTYIEPKPDQVVFSQAIGMSYDYYAYPGKLEGNCSIEVDRMSSYWRSRGKSSGWSWFRKKTRSWDQTRQTVKNDMGMECTLSLVPQGSDPDEAARLAEQFERAMYSDMWQMFLSIYAKDYKVEVIEPDVPDAEQSTVGNILGTGLMDVCSNKICQFSGIVLKSLDELGGSKAQGTTSSINYEYGKIWKSYDRSSWAIKQGNSLINMKVCVDSSQCGSSL